LTNPQTSAFTKGNHMKLQPGAVIHVTVETASFRSSRTVGYWLVTDIHDFPFSHRTRHGCPQSYGVVRCTKTGKPFKYKNGFKCEWVDAEIENGFIKVIK